MHRIGEEGAPGQWQRFETTFTTGEQFESVNVYLYNTHSTVRAWFRDLQLRTTETFSGRSTDAAHS